MDNHMDKANLLDLISTERARWEAALAEVAEGRMEEPGVDGDWSVKDVIAHITWHEREMVKLLRRRSLAAGSDLWNLPTHERNATIYGENRDRTLADVLAEAREVYPQFVREAEGLSEEDLHDPTRFDMPPDWLPWRIIAENSYEHYADHTASLRAWLADESVKRET